MLPDFCTLATAQELPGLEPVKLDLGVENLFLLLEADYLPSLRGLFPEWQRVNIMALTIGPSSRQIDQLTANLYKIYPAPAETAARFKKTAYQFPDWRTGSAWRGKLGEEETLYKLIRGAFAQQEAITRRERVACIVLAFNSFPIEYTYMGVIGTKGYKIDRD